MFRRPRWATLKRSRCTSHCFRQQSPQPLMKILVIDVGGTHVKVIASGRRARIKFASGPKMTPRQMVAGVLAATAGWQYDVVSIGYPGPVLHDQPMREPHNLGGGWVGFNFQKAFG